MVNFCDLQWPLRLKSKVILWKILSYDACSHGRFKKEGWTIQGIFLKKDYLFRLLMALEAMIIYDFLMLIGYSLSYQGWQPFEKNMGGNWEGRRHKVYYACILHTHKHTQSHKKSGPNWLYGDLVFQLYFWIRQYPYNSHIFGVIDILGHNFHW